jgi:integrase
LLTWAAVDWEAHTLRLEAVRCKSGEPRVYPFALAKDLKALLEARWVARDGLYVFHRHAQPLSVGTIRGAWTRATTRAGLVGRLIHDLRRTAARDMRRQGLSESDIMALAGWETTSMFRRYAIRDEAAVGKRFGHVTSTLQEGSPAVPSSH